MWKERGEVVRHEWPVHVDQMRDALADDNGGDKRSDDRQHAAEPCGAEPHRYHGNHGEHCAGEGQCNHEVLQPWSMARYVPQS